MRRNQGFTLIEILAGIGLFLVGAVSAMALYTVAAELHKRSHDRSQAVLMASSLLGWTRAQSVSSLRVGGAASGTINPTDGDIPLEFTFGSFSDFPTPVGGEPEYALILDETGTARAERYEWISYTGKDPGPPPTLTGCVRGLADSSTEAHPDGSLVVPAHAYPPGYRGGGRAIPFLYATVLLPPPDNPAGTFENDAKLAQIVVGWTESGVHRVQIFRTATVNASSQQ